VPGGLRGWQFDVASGLLKRVTTYASEFATVCGRFPLSTNAGKPEVDLRKAAYDVLALDFALLEAGRSLSGTPLEPLISTALTAAAVSASRLRALARSITLEDLGSRNEKRAWTWTGVATEFNAVVRPTMTEPGLCGWEELIEGRYLFELDDQIDALIQQAMGLVTAPPLPDHVGHVIRQGSAHEEHVRGNRRWCALCGWLDMIDVPTATHRLYHADFGQTTTGGPHN
jgi:hypothetical protein